MANPSLFTNLGRAAKVVALLLFFLPWVTVSCSTEALDRMQSEASQTAPRLNMGGGGAEIPIADASGLNMAIGKVRVMPGAMAGPQAGGPEMPTANQAPEVPIEIGVIAGAALILLALVASFLLKGGAGAIVGIGGSALAIAAFCYSVFISYPPAIRAAFAANNPSAMGGGEHTPTADQLAQILSVKPATGFWLALLMLALAIVFNVLAMRKPAAAAAAPPAGP